MIYPQKFITRKLLILFFLSLIAVWPFFRKGFFESHDGEWMVIRFSAFHQTLANGQFPVRFVDRLNNNFGYPVMNFLYPLPFYLSEIPKIIGFNFINSVKITFVLSTIFSVPFMYWALLQFFSKEASLAGTIVYLFIPYRFVDLYVRGSIGESVAFAFIPLILGSIIKISKGEKVYLPILSASTALLILAHNVIAVLFLPILILLSLFIIQTEKLKIIGAFLFGLLISAFFWLPALYDLQFVKLPHIKVSNVSDHLVPFSKLVIPSWGFGPSPQDANGFSVQLGIVAIALFISAAYFQFVTKKKSSLIIFLLIIFLACSWLMTKSSSFFWENIPHVSIIQFPWRLLSLIVFTSAILAAFTVDSAKKDKLAITILLIGASIISTVVYTKPSKFVNRGDGYYSTNEDTTTVKDEYMPIWVLEKSGNRAEQKIEVEKPAQIASSIIRPTKYEAEINTPENTSVKVNTIYFPGWQAYVDKKIAKINYLNNPNGLITFELPRGDHQVIIVYGKTPAHLFSEIVSMLALIGTGLYFLILWRKENS